jgi:hypothetical protein
MRVRRMHVEATAQRLVGGTNSRRLVDADLLGDGQVQREVEKGVHLPVLGRELLLHAVAGFSSRAWYSG